MGSENWQPIEKAPRDGEPFLATDARGTFAVVDYDDTTTPATWGAEGWNYSLDRFTHWMPLPTPPSPYPSGD